MRLLSLAKQLRHMAQQAGIRDEHKLTQLTESGIFSYSKARRDLVLAVNYLGVGENSRVCVDAAEDEERDGILSQQYKGVPFVPCRIHPRNVVFRCEGAKARIVADIGAPRGGEEDLENSVNAGIDFTELDRLARMELTSSVDFARATGILQTSAADIWVARSDYSRYYRQNQKP
eukprot:SAG11_NODE_3457_length_2436_cov_12.713308_1_plen_175_part_00